MSMIALYAARRGLFKDVLHIMAMVAWIMLIWDPYFLLDVSFQLSFLVTLGLIVGVQRVNDLFVPWISSPIIKIRPRHHTCFPNGIFSGIHLLF